MVLHLNGWSWRAHPSQRDTPEGARVSCTLMEREVPYERIPRSASLSSYSEADRIIRRAGRCELASGLAYRAIPVFRPGEAEFRQRLGFQVLIGERKDDALLFIEMFA